jgi:hypothetical protein
MSFKKHSTSWRQFAYNASKKNPVLHLLCPFKSLTHLQPIEKIQKPNNFRKEASRIMILFLIFIDASDINDFIHTKSLLNVLKNHVLLSFPYLIERF